MESIDNFIKLHEVFHSNNCTKHLSKTKLTARETGLPVDILIYENCAFTKSGFGKLIKFQGDKSDSIHNWIPLTIDENPEVPIDNVKHNLSSEDTNKLILFVKRNLQILNKFGDLDFGITEFVQNMSRV